MTDVASQSTYSYLFDSAKLDRLLKWSDSPTLFGIRISALVETTLFLSAVTLFSTIFGNGTRYFSAPLHPFWIIVLLITVQYGIKESIAAAVLSGLFLLVGNMSEQSISESIYGYLPRVFSQPMLWLAVALVLGAIRQRQLGERAELTGEFLKMEESVSVIVQGYSELKSAKELLEMRLAEERSGLMSAFDIAKNLNTLDIGIAAAAAEKLVRTALNPVKFSIFEYENGVLSLYSSYGWNGAGYTKVFDANSPVTQHIVNEARFLSIAHASEEKVLNGEGLMAGPIIDRSTGKIFGMLKIEDANFLAMGIRTHQTFKLACEWIGQTAANIDKFHKAEQKSDIHVKKGKRYRLQNSAAKADSERYAYAQEAT